MLVVPVGAVEVVVPVGVLMVDALPAGVVVVDIGFVGVTVVVVGGEVDVGPAEAGKPMAELVRCFLGPGWAAGCRLPVPVLRVCLAAGAVGLAAVDTGPAW